MAQLLIRNLDQEVVESLKTRARSHGRSLQAEAKEILEQAARIKRENFRKAAERIRRSLEGRPQSDSVKLLRADRNR